MNDYHFWLAIYRAVMAIAAAIRRYKLKDSNQEVNEVDVKAIS